MRLLNVDTLEFRDFNQDNTPPYAVTSHRWSSYEASYKDIHKRRNRESPGYQKIRSFCAFAAQLCQDEHTENKKTKWIWIDTCCINQNSSAEVSESINSMWEWYRQASHCIAHLKDVRSLSAGRDAVMYDFRRSEWFERGWTLQELLAPQCVVFVNQNWELIGRKSAPNHACAIEGSSLEKVISEVTSIPQDVLCEFESHRGSIGQAAKWAWAANRRTTKAEDVAYCLLGIFDVHMPLIYGEGEYNARKRLYQEIKKKADEDKDNDFQHPVRPHPSASQSSYEGRADADILSHALAMMKIDRGNVRRSSWPADETSSTSSDVEITTEPQEVIMVATEVPIAPPLQDVQTDDIDEDERCPKCRELLFEPVTTSCKHSFCAACMSHQADDELALIWEPLESGNIQGDAAQENFGRQYSCPVCGAQALLYHNTALAQQLQIKHPRTFAQRSETAHAADDDSGFMSIAIGNWHDLVRADHHRWTFFIKPSRTDIIREVHVNLHESFAEPHKVLRRPPYKLNCRGWGYFTVGVQLILQPGYVWLSKNAEDALDGTPGAALKLQWTLDFASHGGLGSMGRCRVKMQRQNRR